MWNLCLAHAFQTVRTLTHSDVASIPSRDTLGLVMHSIKHCWDLKWDATKGFCSGHCTEHSGIQDEKQQQSCKNFLAVLTNRLILDSLLACV